MTDTPAAETPQLNRAAVTGWVIALFALAAGLAVGFQLRDPIAGTWVVWREIGPDGWDSWQRVAMQVSPGLALPVAAGTVAAVPRPLPAWILGAAAAIGLAGLSAWDPAAAGALVWHRYAVAAVAGVLIGAAITVAWRRRAGSAALLTGLVGAIVIGPDLAAYRQVEQFTVETMREPLWWWLPAVLVLLAVTAVWLRAGAGSGSRLQRPAMVIAGAVVVAAGSAGLFVAAGAGPAPSAGIIGAVAAALVLIAAVGTVVGGEALTGLAGAFAVSVAAIAVTVGSDLAVVLDPAALLLAAPMALLGAYAGRRWPSAGLGFVVLAVIAGLAGLDPDDGGTLTVFRLLVTAGAAVYLLCSLRLDGTGGAVLTTGTLVTVSAPAAWSAFLTSPPWNPLEPEPITGSSPGTIAATAGVAIVVCAVLAGIGATRTARAEVAPAGGDETVPDAGPEDVADPLG